MRKAFPVVTNFAGGSYQVQLITEGLQANEARLVSTGRFGEAEARVGDARNAGMSGSGGGSDPLSPSGQSIFANGNLRFSGTSKGITGSLFTNQEFRLNGQYTNVDGIIYART